jgi:nuclear pore complex protein Nup205
MADARTLNDSYFTQSDQDPWLLPYLQAAFRAWWLAEYSGWYGENADGTIPDNQLEDGKFDKFLLIFVVLLTLL